MNNRLQTSTTLSPFFIKNWLAVFLFSLLTYFYYIINFLWGNHDWGWIKEKTPLFSGVFEGRFSQFILQTILTEGYILPIITLILSFFFYSLGITLLLHILGLKKSLLQNSLIGIFALTSPYTISWLYFAFISLSCLSWPFFIILAFYLLTTLNTTPYPKTCFTISSILFLLSMGGYPPVINMIGTVFFILVIDMLYFKRYTLKSVIKKILPMIFSIFISIVLLLIIQYFLKKYNLQHTTYNTASLSLSNITPKLYETLIASFEQFTNTTSFITYFYKYITLCLTLSSVYVLITRCYGNTINFFLLFVLLLGLNLSSVITNLIAQNTLYVLLQPRIEFFGILYIYIFSASVLLKQDNIFIKNLTLLSLILIIFNNVNTINYSAKVQKLGFMAETQLINRITADIENKVPSSTYKKHTFIQGGVLNYRNRFYFQNPNENVDGYTLSAPYIPWHLPSKAYKFYAQTDIFGEDFDVYWRFVPQKIINQSPSIKDYLLHQAKPWPDNNSIFTENNLIVLILNDEGLKQGISWIKKYQH